MKWVRKWWAILIFATLLIITTGTVHYYLSDPANLDGTVIRVPEFPTEEVVIHYTPPYEDIDQGFKGPSWFGESKQTINNSPVWDVRLDGNSPILITNGNTNVHLLSFIWEQHPTESLTKIGLFSSSRRGSLVLLDSILLGNGAQITDATQDSRGDIVVTYSGNLSVAMMKANIDEKYPPVYAGEIYRLTFAIQGDHLVEKTRIKIRDAGTQ